MEPEVRLQFEPSFTKDGVIIVCSRQYVEDGMTEYWTPIYYHEKGNHPEQAVLTPAQRNGWKDAKIRAGWE